MKVTMPGDHADVPEITLPSYGRNSVCKDMSTMSSVDVFALRCRRSRSRARVRRGGVAAIDLNSIDAFSGHQVSNPPIRILRRGVVSIINSFTSSTTTTTSEDRREESSKSSISSSKSSSSSSASSVSGSSEGSAARHDDVSHARGEHVRTRRGSLRRNR